MKEIQPQHFLYTPYIVQDSVSVSEHFVKNCHCALKLVTMPTSEEDIGRFFTDPSPWQQKATNDESDEVRGESPPKPKRSKREVKALNVRTLQVSISLFQWMHINVNFSLYRNIRNSSVMPGLLSSDYQ